MYLHNKSTATATTLLVVTWCTAVDCVRNHRWSGVTNTRYRDKRDPDLIPGIDGRMCVNNVGVNQSVWQCKCAGGLSTVGWDCWHWLPVDWRRKAERQQQRLNQAWPHIHRHRPSLVPSGPRMTSNYITTLPTPIITPCLLLVIASNMSGMVYEKRFHYFLCPIL